MKTTKQQIKPNKARKEELKKAIEILSQSIKPIKSFIEYFEDELTEETTKGGKNNG